VTSSGPNAIVRAAVTDASRTLSRLPGREVRKGLHEVREFGPALRESFIRNGLPPELVALSRGVVMANWTRATSQVDLVVLGSTGSAELALELKAWDIGHQLFDLAKVCCLLAAGVHAGFLICVAERDGDFDLLPGGELFPAVEGEVRSHDFLDLIVRNEAEWLRHVGEGGPEPTAIPTAVTTSAVVGGTAIAAYPGHSMRAVRVAVTDPTPIPLEKGTPEPRARG
jgi:hypothetical protein